MEYNENQMDNLITGSLLNEADNQENIFTRTRTLHEKMLKELTEKFDKEMEKYVRNNLEALGFQFSTDAEFIEIIKTRVERIGYSQKPNYYEFYVRLDSGEKKLVGMYSNNVEIKEEAGKFSITIGAMPYIKIKEDGREN